jgi:hypothetical protein
MRIIPIEEAPRPRRRHPRFEYVKDVCLRVGDALEFGRLANIGLGGAYVQGRSLLTPDADVTLLMTVPGIAEICEVPCQVRWTDARCGAGLQFGQLRPEVANGLVSLERTFGHRGPAR